MNKYCIKVGKLIDTKNSKVLDNQIIEVEGGRIKSVSSAEGFNGVVGYDFSDKTIMPGMINSHIHIGFEPDDEYRQIKKEFGLEKLISYQLEKLIKSGVTCVRNLGSIPFIDIDAKINVPNGLLQPEILCSGPAITCKNGHGSGGFGTECESIEDCVNAVNALIEKKVDVVKIIATGGVITKGTNLDAVQFEIEELKAMTDICKEKGILTSAHAHGTLGIKLSAEAGINTIEHGTFIDDEGIDLMLEHGTWLVPTLNAPHSIKTNGVAGGLDSEIMEKMAKVYDIRLKNFMKCYKAGVKVAMGTDAGTPFNKYDYTYHELKMMNDLGVPAMDVIKIATMNTAEMLNISDDYGSIEQGKLADFIVLPKNPIEDGMEVIKDLEFVFKKGEKIEV